MTSNHPTIEPQGAAPAHTPTPPAVNAAQVNVTSTGDIQVVVRESGPGEPWFQMLRREFEDGTWAALQDRHRNVLPVMCSLRDRDTGLAYAPAADFTDAAGVRRPGLLSRTGMSKTALYNAIAEMTAEPSSVPLDAKAHLRAAAGLLARCGRDLFVVLPDRVFAGRKPVQPAESRFPPTGIGSRPFPSTGKVSRARESQPLLHRETQARSNKRIENSSTTTNLSDPDREESLRLLTGGIPPREGEPQRHHGFEKRDAERTLERSGASLADVRTAVANAAHVARSKQGLTSWRGYVRRQLEQGCSLFPSLQRERDNARRVTGRLHRLAQELGDEATCGALTAWWARQSPSRIAGLVGEPAWNGADEDFWAAVTRKVSIEIPG
jgi:hypothetical protein